LQLGERIVSAYRLADGAKIWIITEADRSARRSFSRRNTKTRSAQDGA
jgi:hypothetical protein